MATSSGKVLVAGASGLVGYAAIRHFLTLPGWQVVGISRRVPEGLERADRLCRPARYGEVRRSVRRPERRDARRLRGALREAGADCRLARTRPDGNQPANVAQPVRSAHCDGNGIAARHAAARDESLRLAYRARAGSGARAAAAPSA